MINSSGWIVIILIGAVLVTAGNIQYNRAREAETKTLMAKQTMELLTPEIQRNYNYLKKIFSNKELSFTIESPFEVSAWQTVSSSDLLLGLDSKKLSTLIQVYYLMNRANTLHKKYINLTVGIESALSDSKKIKELISGHLINLFNELHPLVESLNKK